MTGSWKIRINSELHQISYINRFQRYKKKNRHERMAIFPFVSLSETSERYNRIVKK